MNKKHTVGLSDEEIIEGLRKRDSLITRDYFYGFCRIAYHIYDKRYDLSEKEGMDFYSIAHEYYLSLDKHDFHQLEDRRPDTTLKTWMINGFRFVLLDRMKSYQKEHRIQSFEERIEYSNLEFDIPDNNFSENFRNTVLEICRGLLGRDSSSSIILQMILLEGYKGKEVAMRFGVSPSAITQKYHKLMENVVIPYFKRYYVASPCMEMMTKTCEAFSPETVIKRHSLMQLFSFATKNKSTMQRDYTNRITPNYITNLQPGEIFVFGSNLAGMHGGGAARAARLYFGAVLGNGDGPQGQSYAIPTMQGGVETIRPYVDKFINYAKAHPEQTFLVTPIGCGIAGFSPEDIAPLFEEAIKVENIHLPQSFWNLLV
jgi:DNA-directed RNA polymerase specialized sigma24 family protein